MPNRWLCHRAAHFAVCIFLLAACSLCAAQQLQVTLDPAQSEIEWTLSATMHTVHGTFRLRSGSVKFDPGSGNASGEIVVDATSGESGNEDRDADMHSKVLESGRYPEIVFVPRHIVGTLAAQGKSSLQMQGVFRIHGAEHDFTLPLTVAKTGSAITAGSGFAVPYQDWGMKNPSKMFLHVENNVNVTVLAVGRIEMSQSSAK